jgi:hypothetical protein
MCDLYARRYLVATENLVIVLGKGRIRANVGVASELKKERRAGSRTLLKDRADK